MRIRAVAVVSIVLASSLPQLARADEPTSPPPSAPAAAPSFTASLPDVVQTKDGSMYRGTILEKVVGDHVDLRLASGETRRFGASDVAYAGSAGSAPGAAPASPAAPAPTQIAPSTVVEPAFTVEGQKTRVRFEANRAQITVLVRSGEATVTTMGARGPTTSVEPAYTEICAMPCTASVPMATHRLALAKGGGAAVEADAPVTVSGPSTVRGHYKSRLGERIAGWTVFGLGFGGGLTLVAVGAAQMDHDSGEKLMLAAAIPTLFGLALGLPLALQHDKATFEVLPLQASSLPGRREGLAAPEGITLRARF